jgi:hypothetical protein
MPALPPHVFPAADKVYDALRELDRPITVDIEVDPQDASIELGPEDTIDVELPDGRIFSVWYVEEDDTIILVKPSDVDATVVCA